MGPMRPPSPMAGGMPPAPQTALAGARPNPAGAGGGMSEKVLLFLAGLGFQHFAKAMKEMRGDKGEKKSPAGGLMSSVAGSRTLPQNAVSPPSGGIPPLLAGGTPLNFMALLAQLGAAANRGNT